ncbi:hypothetical protein DSO57_1018298 [Entomophthora muscae]|uniref:Uncharacterized protein n=1 Tax=Entomophthora muscae TaxID=34485 RepID=A0ACC2UD80_9FUNG|nr:hypothetical protein DSO57_1018298 [Entomophthora muscae]
MFSSIQKSRKTAGDPGSKPSVEFSVSRAVLKPTISGDQINPREGVISADVPRGSERAFLTARVCLVQATTYAQVWVLSGTSLVGPGWDGSGRHKWQFFVLLLLFSMSPELAKCITHSGLETGHSWYLLTGLVVGLFPTFFEKATSPA